MSAELPAGQSKPIIGMTGVTVDSAAETKLTGGVRRRFGSSQTSTPLALPGPVAFVAGEFLFAEPVAGEDGRPLAVAVTTSAAASSMKPNMAA